MAIIGAEAQSVAVAWQVYEITHSALDLGLTGLSLFLPGLVFMLAAGHTADRYDRRRIILLCYGLQAICTGMLLWLSLHPWTLAGHRVWPIYAVLVGVGISRAFSVTKLPTSGAVPLRTESRTRVSLMSPRGSVMSATRSTKRSVRSRMSRVSTKPDSDTS